MAAVPFEIAPLSPIGKAGSNGKLTVCLAEEDGRMFRRRAIKRALSPSAEPVEWLVVELDGVKVYVHDGGVIVTRRDLRP